MVAQTFNPAHQMSGNPFERGYVDSPVQIEVRSRRGVGYGLKRANSASAASESPALGGFARRIKVSKGQPVRKEKAVFIGYQKELFFFFFLSVFCVVLVKDGFKSSSSPSAV